eukprot:1901956-Pleurochrysis_carterae.AAC.1
MDQAFLTIAPPRQGRLITVLLCCSLLLLLKAAIELRRAWPNAAVAAPQGFVVRPPIHKTAADETVHVSARAPAANCSDAACGPPMPPASVAHACAPHFGEHSCAHAELRACRSLWGFVQHVSPCFDPAGVPASRWLPVSCACLVQCDGAGLGATNLCVHDEPLLFANSAELLFNLSVPAPWRGALSASSAPTLSRAWPELNVVFSPSLWHAIEEAAAESRAAHACSAAGIDSRTLARACRRRAPKASVAMAPCEPLGGGQLGASGECVCLPGRVGDSCERTLTHASGCMHRRAPLAL